MTITAKVNHIAPPRQDDELPEGKKPTNSVASSRFVKADNDPWKAMTSSSDIGEMTDAMQGIQNGPTYRGPIDWLSGHMVINDPRALNTELQKHELPHIPDLHKELLFNNSKLATDFKPIVERYEALLSTVDDLIENAIFTLKQPMSPIEIQSTQKYVEALRNRRLNAEKQLDNARYYLSLQAVEKNEDV